MRVGVNLQSLRPGLVGGLEVYVRSVLTHALDADPFLEFVLHCATYNVDTFDDHPRVERTLLTDEDFAALSAAYVERSGFDLWFCPLLTLEPHRPGVPAVVLVPDVQHETYPAHFPDDVLRWRREHYGRTVGTADRILTLSEWSRADIVEKLDADADKVVAIHVDGAPHVTRERAEDHEYLQAVRDRHDLPAEYLYFPGATWPHKNHAVAFEALHLLKQRSASCPRLVLTGAEVAPTDWDGEFERLGIRDDVQFLGHVPDDDVAAIYALAKGLVFPSKFEGFGMPVVEAMRVGCPVVCSSATCLPEVAGDAAMFFDPDSPDDLTDQLQMLLVDSARREDLREAGFRRAADFSWARTARETVAVFHELAGSGGAPAPAVEDLPLITVVTPSYQQAEFIERTILSVLEQDYPRIEYIVIDGGSTDGTVAILERYKQQYPGVFDFASEPDRGQADAVNKGLARARGDILGWLNSDDTYVPGALRRVAEAFAGDAGAAWLYGRAEYIDRTDAPLRPYPTRAVFEWESLAHECYVCQPAVFLRRRLLDEGFRLDADLQMVMDYDLWIRIGREHQPLYVDRHLANSRMHDDNKTLGTRRHVYPELFATVKRHYGYLPHAWAKNKAHFICQGGDPTRPEPPNRRTTALGALLVFRHNLDRPWYMLAFVKHLGRRFVERLRRPFARTGS